MSENNSNDELISQFMAFTGSMDEVKAASYLEMCGNNVETAVGLFMEHEQGGGTNNTGNNNGTSGDFGSGSNPYRGGYEDDEVRAPDATRTMRLMEDAHAVPLPMGMGNIGSVADAYLMSHLMEEQMMAQQSAAFAASDRPIRAAPRDILNAAVAIGSARNRQESDDDDDDDNEYDYNAMEDEENFDENVQVVQLDTAADTQSRLSDVFAAPVHLTHKAGGFQGARTMAKDTKRWLLVNIQKDSEFSSHALNRDVWRDELVENLIREGFIFWQQFDTTSEGRTYIERYQVHDFPHLAIIDPRTGRLLWRKEGWTQQNPVTATSFAELAMDFCSRNSFDRPPQAPRPGGASVARPAKRSVTEMTEEEQLQEAMRASMEGSMGGGASSEDNEVCQSSGEEIGNEVVVIDDVSPSTKEEKSLSFNDELLAFTIPDEPSDGYRIQLRMPDGKRLVRKFAATDSVRTVYALIAQSNEEARGGREFSVMAGYPPSDLFSSMDQTVEEAKLKGETITVRWK